MATDTCGPYGGGKKPAITLISVRKSLSALGMWSPELCTVPRSWVRFQHNPKFVQNRLPGPFRREAKSPPKALGNLIRIPYDSKPVEDETIYYSVNGS